MDKSGDILDRQLWDAVWEDDIERAKQLLDKGASVNARSEHYFNRTLLILACENKSKAMVDVLLKRGAAVNETDRWEMTALMYAATQGDETIFDVLMKHKADVIKKNRMGWTVIHFAAWHNHKLILDRLLLPHPSSTCWESTVDVADKDGHTPLWCAVHHGHVDCADVLLVHGSSPYHKSEAGVSPLDIARSNSHTRLISVMTEELKSHFVQYAIDVISKLKETVYKQEEKIRKQEMEIQQLKNNNEQLQLDLRQSVSDTGTNQTAEIQQKDEKLKELSSVLHPFTIGVETTDHDEQAGAENDLFITLDTTVKSSDGTVQPVTVSVSSNIGPEGGMVEFPSSNVSLIVPKAAVSSDTTFCLKTYVHPDYLPLATSDDEMPISPSFQLSSSLPRGHKFGNRLQLSLPVEVPRIACGRHSGWKLQLMRNELPDGVSRTSEWHPVLQLNTKTGEVLKLDTKTGELSAVPESSFVHYDQDSGTIGLDHFCSFAWVGEPLKAVGEAVKAVGSMLGILNPERYIDYAVFGQQIQNHKWHIAAHIIHRSSVAYEALVRNLKEKGYVELKYPSPDCIQLRGEVSVRIHCLEPWRVQHGKVEVQINTRRIWGSGLHSSCYHEVTIEDTNCSADTLECIIDFSFCAKGQKDPEAPVAFTISRSLQSTKPQSRASAVSLPRISYLEDNSSSSIAELMSENKVFQAVMKYGVSEWHSIGLEMGFTDSQIKASTFEIPSLGSKLQAILVRKIHECGVGKAEERLLNACKRIPLPIIGSVLDYVGRGSGTTSDPEPTTFNVGGYPFTRSAVFSCPSIWMTGFHIRQQSDGGAGTIARDDQLKSTREEDVAEDRDID